MNSTEAKQILGDAKKRRRPFLFMTPRQRVNAAIAHKPVDQIPFDLWASPDAWKKLKSSLDVENHEAVLDLLDVDCRIITPHYRGPAPVELGNGVFVDALGSHRRFQNTSFGRHKELVDYPLKNAQTIAEVESYPYLPKPEYWDCSNALEQIKHYNQNTEYHIRFETCGIFEYAWALIGLENFLVYMAEDNMEIPNTVMAIITELFIQITNQILSAGDGKIDMVYIYDDVGTQNAPMISVNMWKKYILPWYRKYLDTFTSFNVQLMYHSCGSIYPFISHLIKELGIDVLNPLQSKAKNMDIRTIKKEFGDRLAFHGAIDTQEILPFGKPLEVQRFVENTCAILGEGGGYICAPAHKLQADVPFENVVAMYTTSRRI